jgi:hypothetical protein
MRPLAAVCLLFFLLVNGQNHAQTNSAHTQHAHADADSGQNPALQIIQTTTPCGEQTSPPKKEQSQAESKPWLTHGEWVISILTFIYVGVNVLIWIRIGHQSDAMNAANDISRKNMEAVQRAFVFVKKTDIFADKDGSTGQVIAWRFRPTWENSGTTPTRQLELYGGAIWQPAELDKGYAFPGQIDSVPLVLGPKAIIWAKDISIPVSKIQAAHNGALHVYIFGAAKYRDVFDDTPPHITRFCTKITVDGDPTNATAKIWLGAHFEHNCADEDCRTEK